MPFTFSHPAIVLPLTMLPKKWYSLTGLLMGSLTPDFEYFLRMKIQSHYSHSLIGIFWFDIPLCICLAFIFHNYVRNALFDNLPTVLKSRLINFKTFDWNKYFKANWVVILISIFIGIISHLLWDSFTHETGYFVESFSALTNEIEILDKKIPIFKILQHSSSFVGGIFICVALFRLPTETKFDKQIDIKYWSVLVALALVIIAIRFFNGFEVKQIGNLIVTGISAILISLALTPRLLNE